MRSRQHPCQVLKPRVRHTPCSVDVLIRVLDAHPRMFVVPPHAPHRLEALLMGVLQILHHHSRLPLEGHHTVPIVVMIKIKKTERQVSCPRAPCFVQLRRNRAACDVSVRLNTGVVQIANRTYLLQIKAEHQHKRIGAKVACPGV